MQWKFGLLVCVVLTIAVPACIAIGATLTVAFLEIGQAMTKWLASTIGGA